MPANKTPSASLIGGQAAYHGAYGFLYLLHFSQENRISPWMCNATTGALPNYCYYFVTDTDKSYVTNASDQKIDIESTTTGRILSVSNQSSISMTFYVSNSECIDINPTQFTLRPTETKNVTLDDNSINNCVHMNQHAAIYELDGYASGTQKLLGFQYQVNYVQTQNPAPWTCVDIKDSQGLPYYCYYINRFSNAGYDTKADQNSITITDSQPASIKK